MADISARQTGGIDCQGNGWVAKLATLLQAPRRRPLLDPRALPDHLKRDMGFLDGNDPIGRRP